MLAQHLQARGVEAWLDELQLRPGDDWDEQIRQAMRESDTVVSVISGPQPSPNVLVEMGMALAQGKRVVPIVIDADTDISTLSDFAKLQSIQTNDVKQVVEVIATLMDKESGDSL